MAFRPRKPQWPFVLNQDSDLAQGLVCYLPFGMRGAPVQPGLAPQDRRLNQRFTLNGGATYKMAPEGGGALSLAAASSQYAEYAAVLTVIPFSFACWFNATDTSNPYTAICLGLSSTTDYARLGTSLSTNGKVGFQGSQFGPVETSTTFTANTWGHMAATFVNAADKRVFLNGGGRGRDTANAGLAFTPDRTAVGRLVRSSPVHYWNGLLAECGIWNRALTDGEVYNLWHPETRWQLRYQTGRTKWSFGVAAAAGGVTTRRTLFARAGSRGVA